MQRVRERQSARPRVAENNRPGIQMGFFEFGVLGRMTCKMQSGFMWENTVSHASISEVFKATFKATFSFQSHFQSHKPLSKPLSVSVSTTGREKEGGPFGFFI
jgi:hypothetical protein